MDVENRYSGFCKRKQKSSIFLIAAHRMYYVGKEKQSKYYLNDKRTSYAANRQINQTVTCGRSVAAANLKW